MKPARFDYHSPSTLDEAVALLAAGGPDARVLAGGQSLIPMMNFRIAAPSALIDLNGVSELAYIKDEGGVVAIGAMTRQRAIEFSAVVAAQAAVAQRSDQARRPSADPHARHHRRIDRQCRSGRRNPDGAAGARRQRRGVRPQGTPHHRGVRPVPRRHDHRACGRRDTDRGAASGRGRHELRDRGIRPAARRLCHRRHRGGHPPQRAGLRDGAHRDRRHLSSFAAPARGRADPRTAGPRRRGHCGGGGRGGELVSSRCPTAMHPRTIAGS